MAKAARAPRASSGTLHQRAGARKAAFSSPCPPRWTRRMQQWTAAAPAHTPCWRRTGGPPGQPQRRQHPPPASAASAPAPAAARPQGRRQRPEGRRRERRRGRPRARRAERLPWRSFPAVCKPDQRSVRAVRGAEAGLGRLLVGCPNHCCQRSEVVQVSTERGEGLSWCPCMDSTAGALCRACKCSHTVIQSTHKTVRSIGAAPRPALPRAHTAIARR